MATQYHHLFFDKHHLQLSLKKILQLQLLWFQIDVHRMYAYHDLKELHGHEEMVVRYLVLHYLQNLLAHVHSEFFF